MSNDFDWLAPPPQTDVLAKKKEIADRCRVERTKHDKLVHIDGTSRVIGLSSWCSDTLLIRIGKSYPKSDLEALGFGNLSTIGESYFDEIVDSIKADRGTDREGRWDDIITYIEEIDGFGIIRACMLFFVATGKPIPENILAGLLILENVVVDGLGGEPDSSHTGNTLIPRDVFKWYFDSLSLNTTLMESMKIIKKDLGVIRGEDGTPLYFTAINAYKSETTLLKMIDEQAIDTFGFIDDSVNLSWYTEGQQTSIRGIIESRHRICVLTGAGGTGKTTTVKQIVRALSSTYMVGIFAPTGAASKRIADDTLDIKYRLSCDISTIHYFIHASASESWKGKCPNLVIIDEASMVDSITMGRFFSALEALEPNIMESLRIILVGDFSQLPPVGIGRAFNDVIHHELCPIFRLTEVKRTSDPDLLLTFDQVRNGVAITNQVRKFCIDTKPLGLAKTLTNQIDALFQSDPHWYKHTSIIAHRNATIDYSNAYIYNHLISIGETRGESIELGDPLKRGATKTPDWKFTGAKVVFTKNDRRMGVVNGSIGYVVGFGQDNDDNPIVKVSVLGLVNIVELKRTYPHIRLAYAVTVHKAQGSEMTNVIYVHTASMESRELIYTAITRAKDSIRILTPNGMLVVKHSEPIRDTIINSYLSIHKLGV